MLLFFDRYLGKCCFVLAFTEMLPWTSVLIS